MFYFENLHLKDFIPDDVWGLQNKFKTSTPLGAKQKMR